MWSHCFSDARASTDRVSAGSITSALNKTGVDLRVAGGIDFTLANNISVSLKGDVSGLTQKNYLTYGISNT